MLASTETHEMLQQAYSLAEFDTELNVCSLFRFEDHATIANLHAVTKNTICNTNPHVTAHGILTITWHTDHRRMSILRCVHLQQQQSKTSPGYS